MRKSKLKPTKRGYVRNLGRLASGSQAKFYLGHDRSVALSRLEQIAALWQQIESHHGSRPGNPVWDEGTLRAARAIEKGEAATLPRFEFSTGNEAAEKYFTRINALRQAGILAHPSNEFLYETGKQDLVAEIEAGHENLSRVIGIPRATGQTLHEALRAYQEAIRHEYKESADASLTDNGKKKIDQIRTIISYVPDCDLGALDHHGCDEVIGIFRRRPISKRYNKPCARKSCANYIGELGRFFRWLHLSKQFRWRKPGDFDLISRTPRELDDDVEHESADTPVWTIDQLKLLNEYALPIERIFFLLGLNCSYGADQAGRLRIGHLHLSDSGISYIRRVRRKKKTRSREIAGRLDVETTQNRPNSQWNDVLELLTTGVILAWAGFVSYWLVFMNFANGDPLLASINLIQLPFSIAFMAYPLSFVVSAFSSFFYPSKMFAENSKYYSAVPQQKTEDTPWPPVTIQIPVYNEKFEDAIQLTLESAMRARGNYIEKGGAANIIVNDDGIMMFLKNDLGAFDRLMALVRAGGTDEGLQRDEREAFLRLKYYTENGIGFTARPTQNRLGKFKKAGNMNYGMIQLSEVVDDLLAEDGKQVYDEVLMRVSRGRSPPAAASGDIQFGKFIVLLDADSRMHPDIIAMTIPEFLSDPALGFTQHPNLPFNGDENYFSRAIARFTENLYHIVFAVMSRGGFSPPLTGHGVFLNVEAMKKIAFKDEDGLKKYWNEKRVSEDFDMSMALQSLGYIGRYIDFAGYEFAEGVTRNFDEEVKKLCKFGCGASEMIFHPIRDWFRKGILTPQIKQYLTSDTPLSAKTSMMKYLFSYFGIASVFVMFPMQLLLIATGYEWNTVVVSSLILSYQNTAIFAVIGPLSSLILRWKLNQNSIYRERDGTAWNQVKTEAQFIPVFSLLFIGAMFMIFKGVASHLLGLDIRWGATNKDKLEDRNFRDSVREVWSSSGQQIWLGSVAFASIVTAYLWMPTSFSWHIFFGPTVLAAGHVIAPFLLNPAFMANFSKKQAKPSDTDSVGARLAEEAKPKSFYSRLAP